MSHDSSDTRTLPHPRPGTGIQDLAFVGDDLYVLTGYPNAALQVFRLNPDTGAVLSGPINITGGAGGDADGFTVLPNGNFLINDGDASCRYNQYNPSTGALIDGSTITVDASQCTGVDTDGTSLFFMTNFNTLTKTTLDGEVTGTTRISDDHDPPEVEDIAIVR